jgi:hypothetical protein
MPIYIITSINIKSYIIKKKKKKKKNKEDER